MNNWVGKALGEGAFGQVYYFKNRYTGQKIATKRLKLNLKLKQDEKEKLYKRWRQEYEWMQSLKTDFIVRAEKIDDYDFFNYLQKQNPSPDLPVIIMEYCNGGDLRRQLNKLENLNGLTEHEVRAVLHALCGAIEYLHHEYNIEHRDIKPENIVIQYIDNKNYYKLTDFGYARDIPDSTIAQSVVGTRHYVAPEVIDPGCYSKTVDYWSIGVMAFEIICGTRPFIPHQHFINILTNIKLKPQKCIAIVQQLDEHPIECERYQFVEKIFPENRHSPIFIDKMEKWLRLALDTNHQTRGSDSNNQLKFYTDLDNILNTKIVTVFSLKTYKIFYYDISHFSDVPQFLNKLAEDNIIKFENLFTILPSDHPIKSIRLIQNPIDYYVPQWSDTSNIENPPVMLYVTDFLQCDFNVNMNSINVSDTIKKCISLDALNCGKFPIWLIEEFEKHVHFLLSKEQRHVECYVNGLYEYILQIEHQVLKYKPQIDKVYEDTCNLIGRVQQFSDTVEEICKSETNEVSQLWHQKSNAFSIKINKLKEEGIQKVKIRFKSVLRHCKELASNEIYKRIPKSDIFKLNDFRQFLSENLTRLDKNIERMDKCQRVFEFFIDEFVKFIENNSLREIREALQNQIILYIEIRKRMDDFESFILSFNNQLKQETIELIRSTSICTNDPNLLLNMQSLRIDGNAETRQSLSNICKNPHGLLSNGESSFDPHTADVLEESNKLLTLINNSMDIDEQNSSMCVDIPTTVINI